MIKLKKIKSTLPTIKPLINKLKNWPIRKYLWDNNRIKSLGKSKLGDKMLIGMKNVKWKRRKRNWNFKDKTHLMNKRRHSICSCNKSELQRKAVNFHNLLSLKLLEIKALKINLALGQKTGYKLKSILLTTLLLRPLHQTMGPSIGKLRIWVVRRIKLNKIAWIVYRIEQKLWKNIYQVTLQPLTKT